MYPTHYSYTTRRTTVKKAALFSGGIVGFFLLFALLCAIEPLVFLLAYQMVFRAIWPSLPNLNFWAFFFLSWAFNLIVATLKRKG